MIDRLIGLLERFFEEIKFWEIIYDYEMGVIFRFGKVKRVINPGFHWKLPGFIDSVQKDVVVTQTLTIPAQTIITKDLKEITVKTVVKYTISDIEAFFTKVYDRIDAISDTTMIIVKELVTLKDKDECHNIDNDLSKKLRVAVKRWGIEVESASLTDVTQTKSFRLFNEQAINA